MRLAIYLISATFGTALAYPGMSNLMAELAKRQFAFPAPPPRMIGDLIQGATTPVGNGVQNCLNGTASCQNLTPKTYVAPPLFTFGCFRDTCCVWNYIQNDLVKLFLNSDGTCNSLARSAVRFGFHDAGAWSTTSGYGGADGSLLLSFDEINRSENNGLQAIRLKALGILAQYAIWGVGGADLVQFMHNVATVVCPLGPRILTYVGRPNRYISDPPGLLPNTNSPAEELIELFSNKTIDFKELTALIGAHTTAQQFFVDPSRAGQPLDSTPGVWDVDFYSQAALPTPPPGVFRLPSDQAFVNDAETGPGFGIFSNPNNGQAIWNGAYAAAYVRLSLLGVNNINRLTDCTKVLPNPVTSFPAQ